MSVESIE